MRAGASGRYEGERIMKPIDYRGKTAVITGAASGMGRCAGEELVKLGATLVLYLASENGVSVTGSNHVMDCGRLSMQPQ